MKKVPVIPEVCEQGWPPKTFRFTGEWSRQPRYSSRRIARRNNPDVWFPIYRSDDGQEVIFSAWLSEICPTDK